MMAPVSSTSTHADPPLSVASVASFMSKRPWLRRLAYALAVMIGAPLSCHALVLATTTMRPPALTVSEQPVQLAADDPGRRVLGAAYTRKRGRINETRLVGSPTEIGAANIKLLYDQQTRIERDLHEQFSHYVPWAAARLLIVDMARLRFRNLDHNFSAPHRQEIAAQAAAFAPDPFTDLMGTYQRFVFLHSLYDIMLSFERSPLVGCTSFVVSARNTADGHTLVGRNFDFEGPQVLDEHKAVFLVLEDGRIPYASVMWPGFIGTASGMNIEGLAIVIHGARAGEPRPTGEPVAQTVRDVLASARTTGEALVMLGRSDPMVSHMLLVVDGSGDAAIVERVPGQAPYVRRHATAATGINLPLTNHLEGPFADDPKNHEVMAKTSTLPRRKRLDELLQNVTGGANVQDVVNMLRDKRGAGDRKLPLGHRSAIDALIATHSVVMDTTARAIWVSEGPHASGRFVRFDLRELLDPSYVPSGPATVETLPRDDMAADGRYDDWVEQGSPHAGAE